MHSGCDVKNSLVIYRLFTFFKKTFDNGYFFKGECHDFYETVCVLSGSVGITAGKKIYSLNAGDMIFHPPGEFHAIWEEKNSNPTVIIFSFSASPFPSVDQRVFKLDESNLNDISSLLCSVNDNFVTRSGGIRNIKIGNEAIASVTIKKLEIFLISVFMQCNQYISQPQKSTSRLFSQILSVMESNISKPLTTSDLARLCEISVPTLENTVNKYLGYGAITHFNILKLQRAHTMLISGSNVKETAFSLGYSNQNYFSARFKKYYGYSPSSVKRTDG